MICTKSVQMLALISKKGYYGIIIWSLKRCVTKGVIYMPESDASISIAMKTANITWDVLKKMIEQGSRALSSPNIPGNVTIDRMGKEDILKDSNFKMVELDSEAANILKTQLKDTGVTFKLFRDGDTHQLFFRAADHEQIKNALEKVINEKSIKQQIMAAKDKAAAMSSSSKDAVKEMKQTIER